jgi:hypothetical protein
LRKAGLTWDFCKGRVEFSIPIHCQKNLLPALPDGHCFEETGTNKHLTASQISPLAAGHAEGSFRCQTRRALWPRDVSVELFPPAQTHEICG